MGTSILDELEWRGLIAQSTDRDALAAELESGPVTVYSGCDPTAPSLHAGHLIPLLTLRRLQRTGHRPIVLAGGAGGKLKGDRHIRVAQKTPLSNLLLAMLEKLGVPDQSFGDSTGAVEI